jgi:hypothetical protein
VLNVFKQTLERLRRSLSGKADQAYKERDARGATAAEREFSAGEAHAYGVASDEVRDAEEENEERP